MKIFLLVISMWGFDGNEWKYIGNQIVLNHPATKEECMALRQNWSWHENNEYYRFSIECVANE
tara:strand:- start:25 stop:213 length:189 start_codon:yes stop_codon:yes gene_type:complete